MSSFSTSTCSSRSPVPPRSRSTFSLDSRSTTFSDTDSDSLFSHQHARDGSESSASSACSSPGPGRGSSALMQAKSALATPPLRSASDTECQLCQCPTSPLPSPAPGPITSTAAACEGRDFPINCTRDLIISHLTPLLSNVALTKGRPLKIVGLLMSDDAGCAIYSRMTGLTCKKLQVEYEVLDMRAQRDLLFLQAEIQRMNADMDVDGLIFYTPCFGMETDKEIRSWISPRIDVEGFHPSYWSEASRTAPPLLSELAGHCISLAESPIYPCTPLAVARALQLQGTYDLKATPGAHLAGKVVTIINRSDTVGLPLAHMFANESALVFSIDISSIQVWEMHDALLGPCVSSTSLTPAEIYGISDIIISAVPSPGFKVPTAAIKPGCVAINVASGINNFEPDIKARAGLFAERMGSLTIQMLVMNALALRARVVAMRRD